ncbi:MAG: hypothetical protein AAFN78_15325 [Pseudomonadota bacterium]
MNDSDLHFSKWVNRVISLASIMVVAGLICVMIFLIKGFGAVSMGLGMFIGMPVVGAGVLLYLAAVVQDLRRRGAL